MRRLGPAEPVTPLVRERLWDPRMRVAPIGHPSHRSTLGRGPGSRWGLVQMGTGPDGGCLGGSALLGMARSIQPAWTRA